MSQELKKRFKKNIIFFTQSGCFHKLKRYYMFPIPKIGKKLGIFQPQNDDNLARATYRSSHRRCSIKRGVLRNFAKFKGKHLKPATLLKKRLWHRCFPVNFAKFVRTPFLQKTYGRPLLTVPTSNKSCWFLLSVSYECSKIIEDLRSEGWVKHQSVLQSTK